MSFKTFDEFAIWYMGLKEGDDWKAVLTGYSKDMTKNVMIYYAVAAQQKLSVSDEEVRLTAEELAKKIKSALGGSVSFIDSGKTIKTVALCSGGGGDLVAEAKNIGADAFLTGEAKHHEYLYSKDFGISMFVAGHFETENIVCEYLCKSLNEKFGNEIEIKVSDLKNPINHI